MPQNRLSDFLRSCTDVLVVEADEITAKTVGISADTPLHIAVSQGRTELIAPLTAAGADVNAKGDMSETPLHLAVVRRNVLAITLLLDAGADPTLRSEIGRRPVDMAREIGGEIAACFVGLA